jgi:PKD repeat protein
MPSAPTITNTYAQVDSPTTASLFSSVIPNGLPTTAWFRWGTGGSYASTTPTFVGDGTTAVTNSAGVGPLSRGTTYSFCLVATNVAGATFGSWQTFSTPPSSNANLAGLLLSAGTLTPAFDPAVTNYIACVSNHTSSVTVTPTSADTNATIQVRVNGGAWSNVLSGTASAPLPLSVGANPIDVKVTAQDLSTMKTYTVTVTREENHPPVANAGPDGNVYTGDTLVLQGTATDPDGNPILYWHWVVVDAPANATWILSGDANPVANFTPNNFGDFIIAFVVGDAYFYSAPDYVTIHAADNLPPVALATADRTNITVGGTVCFDGSQSSDPEAGPLSYIWDFGDGSPSPRTNAVCHTFTYVGTYDVGLQVRDERGAYDFDFVSITVLPPAVLRVALTSTNTVLIAWPAAVTNYALQQNADLTTTNWLAVTNAPGVVGSEKQVLLSPAAAQNFYRLHKP